MEPMTNEFIVIVWGILLAGTALAMLWNAHEARTLRAVRKWEQGLYDELSNVVNQNADVLVEALDYMYRLSIDTTRLKTKSEIYDLAFKISPEYPEPSEKPANRVMKVD